MFSPSKVQITVYVVKLLFYNPETNLNPILTDYCYYILLVVCHNRFE